MNKQIRTAALIFIASFVSAYAWAGPITSGGIPNKRVVDCGSNLSVWQPITGDRSENLYAVIDGVDLPVPVQIKADALSYRFTNSETHFDLTIQLDHRTLSGFVSLLNYEGRITHLICQIDLN